MKKTDLTKNEWIIILSLFLAGNLLLLLLDMNMYATDNNFIKFWMGMPIHHDLFILLWLIVVLLLGSIFLIKIRHSQD